MHRQWHPTRIRQRSNNDRESVKENAIPAVAKASIVLEDVRNSIDSTKQEIRTNGY